MSLLPLGILAASGSNAAQAYYLATLGGTGYDWGFGVGVDAAKNVYIAGRTSSVGSGGNDFLVVKYNNLGAVQWQKVFGGSNSEQLQAIAVLGSGDMYMVGSLSDPNGFGNGDLYLAKLDTAGNIQWQRLLGGINVDAGYGVDTDSAGDVYVFGMADSTTNDFLLAKYDSAGNLQWQRTLAGASAETAASLTVDSADNVYVAGSSSSVVTGGNFDAFIAKYDSAGNLQWQKGLSSTDTNRYRSVATDSAGDVYAAGSAGVNLLVAKYNSAGTIQWQRTLSTGTVEGYGIATDSANNVYVVGRTYFSTGLLIAKYDSAGNLQWQRVWESQNLWAEGAYGVAIDSSDNLYVTGITNGTSPTLTYDQVLYVLPNDGSLTGTYATNAQSMTYKVSSLVDAPSTLSDVTPTLTSGISSLTSTTASLTASDAGLTATKFALQ